MSNRRSVVRQRWAAIIEAYRASGQTQSRFCEENGLSISSLHYWLRKLGSPRATEESAFVAVTVDANRTFPPRDTPDRLKITLPNGIQIDGVTLSALASVVEKVQPR